MRPFAPDHRVLDIKIPSLDRATVYTVHPAILLARFNLKKMPVVLRSKFI